MPGYRPNWITRSSVTIIYHNCNKICDISGFFKIRTEEVLRVFWLVMKKESARVQWHVLSNYLGMTCTVLLHCPISAEIRTVGIVSQIWEFFYSYDEQAKSISQLVIYKHGGEVNNYMWPKWDLNPCRETELNFSTQNFDHFFGILCPKKMNWL